MRAATGSPFRISSARGTQTIACSKTNEFLRQNDSFSPMSYFSQNYAKFSQLTTRLDTRLCVFSYTSSLDSDVRLIWLDMGLVTCTSSKNQERDKPNGTILTLLRKR
jgi:hypothetical protein